MKKILTFILGMMVVASCDLVSKSSSDKEEVNIDELEGMAFETEQLSFSYDKDKVEVGINVEYPKDGNPILVNAIREYISETLGGTYDGDLEEGQQLVDYYGGYYEKELNDEKQEQIDDRQPNIHLYERAGRVLQPHGQLGGSGPLELIAEEGTTHTEHRQDVNENQNDSDTTDPLGQ